MKLKKNKSYSFETNTDSNTLEEPNYSIDFPVNEKIENHKTIKEWI